MTAKARAPHQTNGENLVSRAARKRAQEAILAAVLADDERRRALWFALLTAKTASDAALAVEQWAEPLLGHTGGWVGAWGWHYWRNRPNSPLPPSVSSFVDAQERRHGVRTRQHGSQELHAAWLVRYQSGVPLKVIAIEHKVSPQAVDLAVSRLASQAGVELRKRRRSIKTR